MVSETVLQKLQGESRVLVLASPQGAVDEQFCIDTLTTDQLSEQHILQISYDREPARVVDQWRTKVGELPASMAIISPKAMRDPTVAFPETVDTRHITAGDLASVGMAASRYLDEWYESGRNVTACVNSMTTLLEHAATERVFRFMHTLTGRFTTAGATAHVHLDPETQDDQTITTLSSLFDTTVRYDGGDWKIQTEE